MLVFFFKQKTAYEMRISDWSSDVCSSDLSDQSIYGVEFQASVSPTRNFTASFNGAYTKVEIDSVSLPSSLPTGVVFDRSNINKYTPSFSGTASVRWKS